MSPPPLFQFRKTNLQAHNDTDYSPRVKNLHRSSSKINRSSDINFRLYIPSGKSLDKLIGLSQFDLSPVNI